MAEERDTYNTVKRKMTRTRYVKLTKIAKEVCDLLDQRKVKNHEGCIVREIAERMWSLKED